MANFVYDVINGLPGAAVAMGTFVIVSEAMGFVFTATDGLVLIFAGFVGRLVQSAVRAWTA